MKKVILFLVFSLTLSVIISLAGCGDGGNPVVPPIDEEEPPTIPKLISPEDGSIFDYYPRNLTLDWESSSGSGTITYVLEHGWTSFFSSEDLYDMGEWGADCTYFYPLENLSETSYSFFFVGMQPGRWRVKAKSEYGESDWSEWFYFRFWI